MFKIRINDSFITYGLISCTVQQNGTKEGVLKTHLYIEEIETLECDRFYITGINVLTESFGSTDPFIMYYFEFENFETYYEELEYEDSDLLELYNKENE